MVVFFLLLLTLLLPLLLHRFVVFERRNMYNFVHEGLNFDNVISSCVRTECKLFPRYRYRRSALHFPTIISNKKQNLIQSANECIANGQKFHFQIEKNRRNEPRIDRCCNAIGLFEESTIFYNGTVNSIHFFLFSSLLSLYVCQCSHPLNKYTHKVG